MDYLTMFSTQAVVLILFFAVLVIIGFAFFVVMSWSERVANQLVEKDDDEFY